MADPITMAVVGGSIGAMTNKKDPLKGALLGAVGGYGGSALMGAAGIGAAGASTAGTSAASGLMPGAVGGFGQAVPALGANAVPAAGIFSGGGTAALGGINTMTAAGPSTGMIPSTLAETSFMDTALSGLKSAGQFAQQNPALTQMAGQGIQQMTQTPEVPIAPPGQVSRSAIQPTDYMSLLNPQQGTVIRPQQISLLG